MIEVSALLQVNISDLEVEGEGVDPSSTSPQKAREWDYTFGQHGNEFPVIRNLHL